jgi:hypothetical protein
MLQIMLKLLKYIPILGLIIVFIYIDDNKISPNVNNLLDYFGSAIFQTISILIIMKLLFF